MRLLKIKKNKGKEADKDFKNSKMMLTTVGKNHWNFRKIRVVTSAIMNRGPSIWSRIWVRNEKAKMNIGQNADQSLEQVTTI